jgi:23S rRNA pseudouridine2457 synthase
VVHQYFVIYKPYGVVSQFSGGGHTLKDFYNFPIDVYPVGRLDKDSEGLLLLTNDPSVHHKLTDPKFGHVKTYWVQVEGQFTESDARLMEKGVDITLPDKTKYKTKRCRVSILNQDVSLPERNPPVRFRKTVPDTWIEIHLTEGKNRQIRRMTAALGFPTLRIVRVAIGAYQMGNMQPGEVRVLKHSELKSCFNF